MLSPASMLDMTMLSGGKGKHTVDLMLLTLSIGLRFRRQGQRQEVRERV